MKNYFFFVIFGAYGRFWIGAYGRVIFSEFSDETERIMEVIL